MRARASIRPARVLRTQVVAALVVLAFVAGNLASSVHAATERHGRCPEHGEVIHFGEETPRADVARTESPGPVAVDAAGDASPHEHEHCYLCPTARERAGLAAATVATCTVPAELPLPRHALAVAPAIADLYIIAPKTSPPV